MQMQAQDEQETPHVHTTKTEIAQYLRKVQVTCKRRADEAWERVNSDPKSPRRASFVAPLSVKLTFKK